MHNGFKVLQSREESGELIELSHYKEHESLAYGLDFKCADPSQNKIQLVSCSFYDCLLKVWNIETG